MENSNNTISNQPKPASKTYLNIGSPETGMLEIDLVSFRQKNEESRYLSLSLLNPSESGEQSKPTVFAIDNEEAFMVLKKFFEQLEWNS